MLSTVELKCGPSINSLNTRHLTTTYKKIKSAGVRSTRLLIWARLFNVARSRHGFRCHVRALSLADCTAYPAVIPFNYGLSHLRDCNMKHFFSSRALTISETEDLSWLLMVSAALWLSWRSGRSPYFFVFICFLKRFCFWERENLPKESVIRHYKTINKESNCKHRTIASKHQITS